MCKCEESITAKEVELNEIQQKVKDKCQVRDNVLHLSPFVLEGERIFSLLQGVDLLRVYVLTHLSSVEHVCVVCFMRQSIKKEFGKQCFIRRILRN